MAWKMELPIFALPQRAYGVATAVLKTRNNNNNNNNNDNKTAEGFNETKL